MKKHRESFFFFFKKKHLFQGTLRNLPHAFTTLPENTVPNDSTSTCLGSFTMLDISQAFLHAPGASKASCIHGLSAEMESFC